MYKGINLPKLPKHLRVGCFVCGQFMWPDPWLFVPSFSSELIEILLEFACQKLSKDLGHSRDIKEFLMDFCFDSLEDAVKEQLDSMSIWVVATQIFVIVSPILGEMIQFDEHIFQKGWLSNQQLAMFLPEMVDFHLGHHPWSLCKWVDATMYVG